MAQDAKNAAEKEKAEEINKHYLTCNLMYHDSVTAAKAIHDAIKKNETTSGFVLGELMMRMRAFTGFGERREWWPEWISGTDRFRSTLLLLGRKGHGTNIHIDWTEALNMALAIEDDWDQAVALAQWLFVKPQALQRLDALLRERPEFKTRFPHGLKTFPLAPFSEADMDLVVELLGDADAYLVQQKAGDIVRVRMGWAHAVVNLQPCIKIAFDRYIRERFPAYALSHVRYAALFGRNMTRDYAGWAQVLWRSCFRSCCLSGFRLPRTLIRTRTHLAQVATGFLLPK